MQENNKEVTSGDIVDEYVPTPAQGKDQFGRFVAIIIRDFDNKVKTTITNDFEIEFEYFKTIDQTKEDDSGVIKVFGLKPSTVKALQQGGGEVELICGYKSSEVSTLFAAKIVRLYYDIVDNTTVTTIQISANLLQYYQVGRMSPDGGEVLSLVNYLQEISQICGYPNTHINLPKEVVTTEKDWQDISEYISTYAVNYSSVADPLTMLKGVAEAVGFEHRFSEEGKLSQFVLTTEGANKIRKNIQKGYVKVKIDPNTNAPITKSLVTYETDGEDKEYHLLTHQTGLISSKTEYKIAKAYLDQGLNSNEQETDESVAAREKKAAKQAERDAKEAAKKAKLESEGKTYKPPKTKPTGGRVEISINRRYNRVKALLNPKILPQSLVATEIPEEEYEYLTEGKLKKLTVEIDGEDKYFTFFRVRSVTFKGNNKKGDWVMDLYCEDTEYNIDIESEKFKEYIKNRPIDEYLDENGNVEDYGDDEVGGGIPDTSDGGE